MQCGQKFVEMGFYYLCCLRNDLPNIYEKDIEGGLWHQKWRYDKLWKSLKNLHYFSSVMGEKVFFFTLAESLFFFPQQ